MTSTPSAPARRRMQLDERRAHLLDVAAEVLVELGPAAITMDRVAERAGVSKALPYRHFANSDDLLLALFTREISAADAVLAEMAADSFEQRLRGVLATWFDLIDQRGALIALLLEADLGPAVAELRDQRTELGEQVWAYLITAEFGIPFDVSTNAAAVLLQSVAALFRRHALGIPRDVLVDQFTAMAIGGLRALSAP